MAFMLLIACSRAMYAVDSIVITTYGRTALTKLSGRQAVVWSTIFGLGSLGLGFATKYCWGKTKQTFYRCDDRGDLREITETAMPGGIRRQSNYVRRRGLLQLGAWGGATFFLGSQVGMWGLVSLASGLRAYRLLTGKR